MPVARHAHAAPHMVCAVANSSPSSSLFILLLSLFARYKANSSINKIKRTSKKVYRYAPTTIELRIC